MQDLFGMDARIRRGTRMNLLNRLATLSLSMTPALLAGALVSCSTPPSPFTGMLLVLKVADQKITCVGPIRITNTWLECRAPYADTRLSFLTKAIKAFTVGNLEAYTEPVPTQPPPANLDNPGHNRIEP